MAWQPHSAVIVHSFVGIDMSKDTGVFDIVQAEESLLIHKCAMHAERKTKEWVNTGGDSVLRVDSEPVLLWDVEAQILARKGLANYHPGRKLGDRQLKWINGDVMPFQFKMGEHACFIFEAPSIDPGPGDLPTISFKIRAQFAELDDTTYYTGGDDSGGPIVPTDPPVITPDPPGTTPPGGTTPPVTPESGGSVTYVDLPVQTAPYPVLLNTGETALLRDVWQGTDSLGSQPFTAQLYAGDPFMTVPNPMSAPLTLGAWTELVADAAAPGTVHVRCKVMHFPPNMAFLRTADHVLFRRGNVPVFVAVLGSGGVSIPADKGLRVPAGVLGLTLHWQLDSTAVVATRVPDAQAPWRRFGLYVCGGNRAGQIPGTSMLVEAWTTSLAGAPKLDGWLEEANTATWYVPQSNYVAAEGTGLKGVAVAPVPWTAGRLRITLGGTADSVVISEIYYPGSEVTAPAGGRLTVPGRVFELF